MTRRPDDAVPATDSRRALVVVAAGSGARLGFGIPKAAVTMQGRTILEHALEAVTADMRLDLMVLVLPSQDQDHRPLAPSATAASARAETEVLIVSGGSSRAESVAAGSAAITEHAQRDGWSLGQVQVLVHDAARALTPTAVFDRVLAELDAGAQAVVPAVEVTDTIKRVDADQHVVETLPRAELRAVQTPQGFTLELLQRAGEYQRGHPHLAESLTDEAMIAEQLGVAVATVKGDPQALKITTSDDLTAAEAMLQTQGRQADPRSGDHDVVIPLSGRPHTPPDMADTMPQVMPRVGIGQDVHSYAPDDQPTPLWLAGLYWPDQQGLAGHSDGDAVAHACCDALFSAAGLGDMGVHFGTDRPELAGAAGATLLAEAAHIVRQAGFVIGSIAVQFIGRRPRFGPRREEAQRVLSEAAGAPVAASATTSDGLGFTGRGEGVSATATAVLIPQN